MVGSFGAALGILMVLALAAGMGILFLVERRKNRRRSRRRSKHSKTRFVLKSAPPEQGEEAGSED